MNKKYLIITGAGGFLGSYFSKKLSKDYEVIAVDINKKSLKYLKKDVEKITTYQLDISNEVNIKKLFRHLKSKKIFVYGLINNAAIDSIPRKKKGTQYTDVKSWDKELDVGLKGSYLMTKVFGEEMQKKRIGKIINIGSDLSVIAPNQKIYKKTFGNFVKPITYSVIKHGLYGMTKYFSSFYADANVTVNMYLLVQFITTRKKVLSKN